MRTDDEDISSCIEVIPSPFGDGESQQGRGRDREEGSPESTITTSSSYIATRHLGKVKNT